MSEFTPGPWHIAHGSMPDFDGSPIVTIYGDKAYNDGGGEIIAVTVDEGHRKPHDTANTYLISAAPDMYDAIKAALCDDPDWRRLCVEALAKAEGRAK